MKITKSISTLETESPEDPPDPWGGKERLSQYEQIRFFIDEKDFLAVTDYYPFVVTPYYLSLAQPSLQDPIMLQICPSPEELKKHELDTEDPLAEEDSSPLPGLVHRYPDRVLMLLTNVCFMNCRHCTRKRLWKKGRHARSQDEIERMLEYLREHKEIRDVIVSGGDPLTMSDAFLDNVLEKLRRIPQIEIIRIGTRAPVVYPDRITPELVSILKKHRPLWLNTQFNHFREITAPSSTAVNMILEAGIPVNNQTVLLKGVNDDAETMIQLCHGLLKIGVRPYYLFHCDPVAGVSHFRTSISKGIEIIERMRGHTSGLAVPLYVVDAIRGGGKIPLQPMYMLSNEENVIMLRNYNGECFVYNDVQA